MRPLRITIIFSEISSTSLSLWLTNKKAMPAILQAANYTEKDADLTLGERAGRLVHDDELCVLAQGFRNGNQLFVGDRHLLDPCVQRNVDVDLGQCILGNTLNVSPVHDPRVRRPVLR